MDSLEKLDFNQNFQEIDIESTTDTINLKNVNLSQSMEHLQQILDQMNESKFYKHINVYFGSKTREKVSYLEEHYNKQLQFFNLSLEEEKEYLKNIFQAKSEEELKLRELVHKQNQLTIKQRLESVNNINYYPCIYIEAEKKGPLFGTIQQDINKHGSGTLSAQIGYRSPFKRYDIFQLNAEWPLQTKFNKRYYQFGLTWSNPIKKVGDFYVRYNLGNDATYENIDTHANGFAWGLNKDKEKYEIEWSRRVPFIHKDVYNELQKDHYHSSNKFSIKYQKVLENSLQHNSVTEGSFSQIKSELGLPIIGHSQFLRLEYNHRKFFDTFWMRKYFQNDLLKKFFWRSTIETNFSAATQAQYGQRSYLNDLLEPIDMRGFQQFRKPVPSYANIKGCLRFNIHNFPILSEANIVHFLYGQLGLSFLKGDKVFSPYVLGSGGMGLSFSIGPAQIELLCNLAQYQNKQLRQPAGFQFRFSMND